MLGSAGMFRIIELKPGQPPETRDEAEVLGPPAADSLLWLDLLAPSDADLALLGSKFKFHPLALEDCAHADQRPKCEEYGDYMFIVSQGFECPNLDLDDMRWYELHVFLGKNYIVTVHDTAIPGLDQVWRRVALDAALMKKGADFLYYLVSDRIVDDNFPILDQISDSLEKLEDDVLENARNDTLSVIFALKSRLVLMRKILSPQRDVMALLSRRGDDRVTERTALYFRDVHDHLARIVESIESNRDLLGNALEAYLSAQSQRTNEIMKALAILSAVFMPLTFITGFFGQNFEHLPFASDGLMWTMVISCVVLPAVLLYWFKRRHWF
jgi:magnesium transporter